MHATLHNDLSQETFLLQFYGWLARGKFKTEERKAMDNLIASNIERLHIMQDMLKWDGRYDLVMSQLMDTQEYIRLAKDKLQYQQKCEDRDICAYVHKHPDFAKTGIILNDLQHLLDMGPAFKRGYLLHDIYHGYPEEFYLFQVDCMDYLHSAAHFYNEGYDYFFKRKTIKDYSHADMQAIHWAERKRLQSSDEVAFRNFREAYINLVFFVESFVNSVGYHAYLSGAGKDESENNQLRGIEKVSAKGFKNYSNLKQRLCNISKIVGGKAIDCEADPIKTYLKTSVELRNQYVHSSTDKPKIQMSLAGWKGKCDVMIDDSCMNIIQKFWKSCYPNTHFPIVIANSFHGNSFKGRPGKYYAEPEN